MARKKKIDKEMGFRLKKARTDQKLTYEKLSEKPGISLCSGLTLNHLLSFLTSFALPANMLRPFFNNHLHILVH